MPPIFSHSRLSSFENCRKQFHFRYVLKIPAESEGIEAFVGKRVHEVLERLYQFVRDGKVPSLPRVLDRYRALWREHFDPDRIRIAREGTPVAFYEDLGVRGLTNYYNRNYPFDESETLALEQRVLFSLDEAGDYRMQGFIDRVSRDGNGNLEIHDYKTGKRALSQKQADIDRQLALYQIGVTERYGNGKPVKLFWHFVSLNRVVESSRTPEQLDALRKETITKIDAIGAETEFPPTKIPLCGWCEYKRICPAWTQAPAPAGAETTDPPRRGQLDLM